jgi:hypothetical protein
VFPLMLGIARPLNTFDLSGRDSLRGLYKDSLTCNGPLRFQAVVVITLPNEEDTLTRIISKPQEDLAIPINALLSCTFGKTIIT